MYPGHDGERIIHLVVIEMTGVSAQIMLYLFQFGGHFVCYHGNGGFERKSPRYFLFPLTYSFLLYI